MTLHLQSTFETYYDVLHVKEDASLDEIRQNYRSALLQSHPDKVHTSFELPNGEVVEDRFLKVQKAWETLGDSRSRALYDDKLRSLRCDDVIADDVSLEDMIVEDNGNELVDFCHQCRCGDLFVVSWSELKEMGYELSRDPEDEISVQSVEGLPGCAILPCSSCSLKIRLLINTNSSVKL